MRKLNIRGLLSVVLTALFLLGSLSAAGAETAAYKSTQSFIDELEREGIKYSLEGVDKDNDERVDVSYNMDYFESATVHVYFHQDGDKVSLRVWDVVKASSGKNFALNVINKLNSDYKYVKYVFDESDNTISGEMDMYIDEATCGAPVRKAVQIMVREIDDEEVANQLKSVE